MGFDGDRSDIAQPRICPTLKLPPCLAQPPHPLNRGVVVGQTQALILPHLAPPHLAKVGQAVPIRRR